MNTDACFFKTSDISLAGALHTLGVRLDSIDRSNHERSIFIFRRNQILDDLVQQYWAKELRVEPQSHYYALRQVKSRLHEAKRQNDEYEEERLD